MCLFGLLDLEMQRREGVLILALLLLMIAFFMPDDTDESYRVSRLKFQTTCLAY